MKKFQLFLISTICFILCCSNMVFASNFYDIKGTKYEGVVDRVARLGIINGLTETTFGANKSITRGQLAKMIVYTRGLQEYADETKFDPIFSDIKDHWAKDYIYVAVDLGVLKGYDDGTFKPDKEVSYAETIAIILRCLGYINMDETSGTTWYSTYVKRFYDIRLDKGLSSISSYTSPAKRGDVAIMWWNMLISDRWAIESENETSGLLYTYSDITQLEKLFPDYIYVTGEVKAIDNGTSGDNIGVYIGYGYYETDSDVPLHALGATATGVYDRKTKWMYGFSIDDEYSDYEIVSGPIFYLEEEGYKLNKAKRVASYGDKGEATYAYLLVSKKDGTIYRVVYVDGSESFVVDSLKVKYDDDKDKEKDETVHQIGDVYHGEDEEPFTTTNAIVIYRGKKVDFEDVPEGAVLTELIKGKLYTYETKSFEGKIENYKNLRKLVIDGDEYIVSDNCIYTVYGKTVEEGKDELKVFTYDTHMDKEKIEELIPRSTVYYLNVAEEICMIEFGKYKADNIIDKYDNSDYKFFYIEGIAYSGSGENISVSGMTIGGKKVSYLIDAKDGECKVGDFIMLTEIDGRKASKYQIIEKNQEYGDDIFAIPETEEFYNDAFGEFALVEDTLFYRVIKEYKDNSNSKIIETSISKIDGMEDLGDISKYKFVLLCNEEMEIDVVFAEREVNKTTYPVARIVELKKNREFEMPESGDKKNYLHEMFADIWIVDGGQGVYKVLSGDCEVGELVTYELEDENFKIKERFKTVFLGYEKDLVITSFDGKEKIAEVQGAENKLNLKDSEYDYNGKVYDFYDYKFLLTDVRKNVVTGKWEFLNGTFYDKEELKLKAGDRIAFGELNGIAIIYRGYTD